jgi:hypothetical protein
MYFVLNRHPAQVPRTFGTFVPPLSTGLESCALTSTVSTSTNSTCKNFSAIGIKFVTVEFVISKILLVEFGLFITPLV